MAISKLRKNKEYFSEAHRTTDKVSEEIENGLALLNDIEKPIATFFGSARAMPEDPYYQHAKDVARALGAAGYAIVSGGGPGIMRAANTGAAEAAAPSIGLKAGLLVGEQVTDKIFTHELTFHFLFVRRFIMSIKSEALIFYPGGFGTLNELFEAVVLMQTGITDSVPLICVNKAYWQGLFRWLEEGPLEKNFFIRGKNDIDLLQFADTFEEVVRCMKKTVS